MAKADWEEQAIGRFIAHLDKRCGTTHAIIGRDVRPNDLSLKDFDYQLQSAAGSRIAVEIFRLVEDERDIARSNTWSNVARLLREALRKRKVSGFLISAPHFVVKKHAIPAFVDRVADELEAAIRSNADKDYFELDEYEFRRVASFDSISFMLSGDARWLDPTGMAVLGFQRKLPTKNEQVDISCHERILLVLNWGTFVEPSDAIHALTRIDFAPFKNIDKIVFEQRPDDFRDAFDRRVLNAIRTRNLGISVDSLLSETLRYGLENNDPEAFAYVRVRTAAVGNVSWLSDNGVRENLVRYATNALKGGSKAEALWTIRYLHNDLDPPPDGANDADDTEGKFNYHRQILAGEKVSIITTVRGHLCGLMCQVIGQNDPCDYAEIISILSRYLSEPNLYIRTQAAYPLCELVRRRNATRNEDGSAFLWAPEERAQSTSLAFRLLRENTKFPRVLRAALHVFAYYRDLSEHEAAEVLDTFIESNDEDILSDVASLLIYFAVFRSGQYDDRGPFDDSRFKRLLTEKITRGPSAVRSSLTWHMWKILKENETEYAKVRPHILAIWDGGYDCGVASMFNNLLLEQLADNAPSDAKALFEQMLIKLTETLRADPENLYAYWLRGTERVLPLFAKDADDLLRVVSQLRDASLAGCPSIGDIPAIFETYMLVPKPDKERAVRGLQKLYGELKAALPNLPSVDWDR